MHSNKTNSINVQCKMNTIFMNSQNSKTSDPPRMLLNLLDKINLNGVNKYIALSNRSIYYIWDNIKKS